MSDWQPISTAPKNPAGEFYGPPVLIWDKATALPWPAQWAQGGPDNTGCWRILNEYATDPKEVEIWPEDALKWQPIQPPEDAR